MKRVRNVERESCLRASRIYGACGCGCGEIIKPGDSFQNINGEFYLFQHYRKSVGIPPTSASALINNLLLERKYTDSEILEKVIKVFPEKSRKNVREHVSVNRSMLNAGKFKKINDGKKVEKIL